MDPKVVCEHKSGDVLMLCADCKILVCETCMCNEHSGHKFKSMKIIAQEIIKEKNVIKTEVNERLALFQTDIGNLNKVFTDVQLVKIQRLKELENIKNSILFIIQEKVKSIINSEVEAVYLITEEIRKNQAKIYFLQEIQNNLQENINKVEGYLSNEEVENTYLEYIKEKQDIKLPAPYKEEMSAFLKKLKIFEQQQIKKIDIDTWSVRNKKLIADTNELTNDIMEVIKKEKEKMKKMYEYCKLIYSNIEYIKEVHNTKSQLEKLKSQALKHKKELENIHKDLDNSKYSVFQEAPLINTKGKIEVYIKDDNRIYAETRLKCARNINELQVKDYTIETTELSIIIIGGRNKLNDTSVKDVQAFHIFQNNFGTLQAIPFSSLELPRDSHCSCELPNHEFIVIGGRSKQIMDDEYLSSSEKYDPNKKEWNLLDSKLNKPRIYAAVCFVEPNSLFLFGGIAENGKCETVEQMKNADDPQAVWEEIKTFTRDGLSREMFMCCQLKNNKDQILLIGGITGERKMYAIYDINLKQIFKVFDYRNNNDLCSFTGGKPVFYDNSLKVKDNKGNLHIFKLNNHIWKQIEFQQWSSKY